MTQPAILVVSCDRYSDLWDPFFEIFRKRWPDCPYPVFLGANHRAYCGDGVRSILVGDDRGWGRSLRLMLDRIGVPRVMLFLEDFLILKPVDTGRVQEIAQVAAEHNVGCLRLFPHPPPTRRVRGLPGIGELQPGDDWRVSTQTAIWDTELLYSLAWPEFSAWDFESIGSLVSDRMVDRFWGVYDPAIDYRHGVLRGRWMPSGLAICQNAGVAVDLEARSLLSRTELEPSPLRERVSARGAIERILPDFLYKAVLRRIRLRRGPAYIEAFKRKAGDVIAERVENCDRMKPGP